MKQIGKWIIWVDDAARALFVNERAHAKPIVFEDQAMGLTVVQSLIAKGYKVG
jgi:hypothetical protein